MFHPQSNLIIEILQENSMLGDFNLKLKEYEDKKLCRRMKSFRYYQIQVK